MKSRYLTLLLLITLTCCQTADNSDNISGNWVQLTNNYHTVGDTIGIEDDFNHDIITTYTIYTDSGFVEHLYNQDSDLIIKKSTEIDLLKIDFESNQKGTLNYFRTDTSGIQNNQNFKETAVIYNFRIYNNYLILDNNDSLKFELSNDELILGNNKYRRTKNSPK